jgi:signal transduction histidine kinase
VQFTKDSRKSLLLSVGGLIIFLFVILVVWKETKNSMKQQSKMVFQKEVEEISILIRDRINEYATVLYGLKGLFATTSEISRNQWRKYFNQMWLMRRIPGMHSLTYSILVRQSEKQAFVRKVRNDHTVSEEGFPGFHIFPESGEDKTEVRNRQEYVVINYIWHWDSNKAMHGLDLLSDPVCRDLIESVRDSGQPDISSKTFFFADHDKNIPGFMIGMPVYRYGAPAETIEERRKAFKGILIAMFRADDLLTHILKKYNRYANIDLEIYDGSTPKANDLFYDDDDSMHYINQTYQAAFRDTVSFNIYHRIWTLYFSTKPGYRLQRYEKRLPDLILYGGILMSILVMGTFFALTTSRSRAIVLAKKINEKYEAQRSLSIRADRLRSLGEMAAGIAHELNQPLVGVRGLAEHILIGIDRGWKMDKKNVQEKVGMVIDQADRMSRIIEHVRIFAREAGKMETQPVFVNDVVVSCINLVGAQFSDHGLTLQKNLTENLSPVYVNPFSLEEVLLNLIVNGRDAVETRLRQEPNLVSPGIIIQTRSEQKDGRDRVIIEIIDNGIGISDEIKEKIFDPFYTTKGSDKGTGLGLSISRAIIEEFGGKLEIQSTPMQMTTATISLPAHQSNLSGESSDGK